MKEYSEIYVNRLRAEIENLKVTLIGYKTEVERLYNLEWDYKQKILDYESQLGLYNGDPF